MFWVIFLWPSRKFQVLPMNMHGQTFSWFDEAESPCRQRSGRGASCINKGKPSLSQPLPYTLLYQNVTNPGAVSETFRVVVPPHIAFNHFTRVAPPAGEKNIGWPWLAQNFGSEGHRKTWFTYVAHTVPEYKRTGPPERRPVIH